MPPWPLSTTATVVHTTPSGEVCTRYREAYASPQRSTAEPSRAGAGSRSCTQASSFAGAVQRVFGSPSAIAEAGVFPLSSPEEDAVAVRARSGPPDCGTTCTWSSWRTVRPPAVNTTGTR